MLGDSDDLGAGYHAQSSDQCWCSNSYGEYGPSPTARRSRACVRGKLLNSLSDSQQWQNWTGPAGEPFEVYVR